MSFTKFAAIIIGTLILAACETVEGAGQDISNAGQALSAESRDVQADL